MKLKKIIFNILIEWKQFLIGSFHIIKLIVNLENYYSDNGKFISTTKKRVLLISRRNAGDIFLNLLKKLSFIDVKIAEISEGLLIPYDCFIYNFEDMGYENLDSELQDRIYLKNGGSFLVIHDQ